MALGKRHQNGATVKCQHISHITEFISRSVGQFKISNEALRALPVWALALVFLVVEWNSIKVDIQIIVIKMEILLIYIINHDTYKVDIGRYRRTESSSSNHNGWQKVTRRSSIRAYPLPSQSLFYHCQPIINTSKLTTAPYHSSDPFLDPPPHAIENITSHIHQPAQLLPWIPLSLLGCREPITAVWFQDGSQKWLALGFLKRFDVWHVSLLYSIETKTCTYKLFYHTWTVFLFSLFNNVFSLLTSHLRRNQQYKLVITSHEGCEGKN